MISQSRVKVSDSSSNAVLFPGITKQSIRRTINFPDIWVRGCLRAREFNTHSHTNTFIIHSHTQLVTSVRSFIHITIVEWIILQPAISMYIHVLLLK